MTKSHITARRGLLAGSIATAAALVAPTLVAPGALAKPVPPAKPGPSRGTTITTKDGTTLYYKDWGTGQPIVFSHGWPLSSDAFEDQMLFLADNGYRCIAHDRRGHGRSSQPWTGHTMDQYAADLDELVTKLGLTNVIFAGHSTGGGEAARFVAQHARGRAAKLVLIGAVTPLMLKTDANPGGLPLSAFDGIRAGVLADRAQFFRDLTMPFYGANRANAKVSQGVRDTFVMQGMMGSLKAEYDCVKAFSETDFTADLKAITIPTLVLHGDDDQIVPIDDTARLAVKLLQKGKLQTIAGAPHGMCTTHKNEVNAALLAFAKA